MSERLVIGSTANRDFDGNEAIFNRFGHRDTIDPNAAASRQRYPGYSLTLIIIAPSILSANVFHSLCAKYIVQNSSVDKIFVKLKVLKS